MTLVEYVVEGHRHKLTARGHAGAAPRGEDLVCCAVSTLVQTLAQRVLDLYSDGCVIGFPTTTLSAEESCVEAVGVGNGVTVRCAYETIVTGLQMLAEQWPQYVTVNIFEIIPGAG